MDTTLEVQQLLPGGSYRGWTVPSKPTLAKYGLTLEGWKGHIDRQGGVCPVCKKAPTTGRGVVDHEHVRGWKAKPPEQRALYVRGVTCWFDNHSFLGRGITVEKSMNVTAYLSEYAARRPT